MDSSTFHPFPRLPKELRLQIWEIAQSSVLPQVIEHDYLQRVPRVLRSIHSSPEGPPPNCSYYQHIAVRMHPVPPLLQACKESRATSLPSYRKGFEYTCVYPDHQKHPNGLYLPREGEICLERCLNSRIRCQHEVASQREVWWDPNKDVILLENHGLQSAFRDVPPHEHYLNSASQVFWLGEIPDQVCEMKIDGVKNLALDSFHDAQLSWWQNEWICDELPFFRGMKRVFLLFNEEFWVDEARDYSYNASTEEMKQKFLEDFTMNLSPEIAPSETWPEVDIVNDTDDIMSLLRK